MTSSRWCHVSVTTHQFFNDMRMEEMNEEVFIAVTIMQRRAVYAKAEYVELERRHEACWEFVELIFTCVGLTSRTPQHYRRSAGSCGSLNTVNEVPEVIIENRDTFNVVCEDCGDLADFPPATVVLLTGDGAGYCRKVGFHTTLERMRKKGWQIEVLSWEGCWNLRMQEWVEGCGVFVPLDTFYALITFLEEGYRLHFRPSSDLQLGERVTPPQVTSS